MPPATIQRDICANMIIPCFATHNYAPMPPVPPVPPPMMASPFGPQAMALETIVNAWWPPGSCLGMNKFTTTVIHQGMCITLDGHDCGVMIPHVQITPLSNNLLTIPIHILFSSRKSNFAASTVKMNGTPASCNTMFSWPPAPMTYCAEPINPPLAAAETSHCNSVELGMTLLDWISGAVAIAAGMLVDWIFRGDVGGLSDAIGKQVIGKLLGAGSLGEWAAKQAAANVGGLIRWVATGEGEIKLGVGSPYMGISVAGGNNDQGLTGGYTSRVGAAEGGVNQDGAKVTLNDPFGQTSESRKWGESGTTNESTDITPTEGFRNETTTTDPNGNVTVVDSGGRGSEAPGAPL